MKVQRLNVFLTMSLATAACQPSYWYLEIEPISFPPSGVSAIVSTDEIELPVGIAIAAQVIPRSDNPTPYDRDDRIVLSSRDDDILDIQPTIDRQEWVLIGLSEGETCIEVEINQREVDCVDAEVVEPNL